MANPHTVADFVELVNQLIPGEAIAYHHGFIPMERNTYNKSLAHDRLFGFIKFCYHFNLIEAFTRKVAPMEYRYYVRLRKPWPYEKLKDLAPDFDKAGKVDGWFITGMSHKLQTHLDREKFGLNTPKNVGR